MKLQKCRNLTRFRCCSSKFRRKERRTLTYYNWISVDLIWKYFPIFSRIYRIFQWFFLWIFKIKKQRNQTHNTQTSVAIKTEVLFYLENNFYLTLNAGQLCNWISITRKSSFSCSTFPLFIFCRTRPMNIIFMCLEKLLC